MDLPSLVSLVSPHLQLPTDAADAATTDIPAVLLVVVYAVVALPTLFTLVMRLRLIHVLIAAGPLLLGFALEQTESWAHGYARVSAGLVLIVPGLKTASVVSSSSGAGIVGALLGIMLLLMIRALPGLLASMNTPSSSIGVFGGLLQFAVLKRIAR